MNYISTTLSLKNKKGGRPEGVAQMIERLPSKREVPSLTPVPPKKKKARHDDAGL
jgi:hypothetical protein